MENSSECNRSDDDGSFIICIDTDDADDFEDQNFNEQEMEITSSDVIIRNLEGSIQLPQSGPGGQMPPLRGGGSLPPGPPPPGGQPPPQLHSQLAGMTINGPSPPPPQNNYPGAPVKSAAPPSSFPPAVNGTSPPDLISPGHMNGAPQVPGPGRGPLPPSQPGKYSAPSQPSDMYNSSGGYPAVNSYGGPQPGGYPPQPQSQPQPGYPAYQSASQPPAPGSYPPPGAYPSPTYPGQQAPQQRRLDPDQMPSPDKIHTEPDSSDKMSKTLSKLQVKNIEAIKGDKIEVTSSDTNTTLLLEEKDAVQTQPVSSTTVKQINIGNSNEEEEVKINAKGHIFYEEKSLHIPTKILQSLIAKAIISSPKGFVAIEDIEKYLIQRVPSSGNKTESMMKLILNTVENNSNVFMPLIVNNENVFERGLWTLHPLAAANFVYYDTLEKSAFKKQKYCHIQEKHTTIGDDKINKAVVAMKRSSTLDYWASKRKVAKMEAFTMIVPSSDVKNKLMNYGLSFESKWGGWNSLDIEQENKISELEKIVKFSDNSVTSGSSKIRRKEHITQDKSTPTVNSPIKSLIKGKGIKRVCLSDSCSDLDSSDNETPANGSIVHKEHNYVASKSSGSKNLIESLRKIVKKMGKDCDKKSLNNITNWERNLSEGESQDEDEDFLGFDYDIQSGYWRGWEKASSKNAERMKEISRSHEGSRNLEDVLRESDLAVTRCIEELERCNLRHEANVHDPTTCDLDATIQKYLKELMTRFDQMAEEPPISYLVLTVMAMCASPEPAVTVVEICHFIQQHFPFHCRGSLQYLEPLVEMLLRLGSPATFSCQKSRRPSNPATCWRVDSTSACGILARALGSAKMRNQPTRSPLKKTTEEDKMNTHDLIGKNSSESQQGVIVHANMFESPNKTCYRKHEVPINIHRVQLMGEKHISSKENMVKHFEITADFSNNSQIPIQISPGKNAEKNTVKDFNKSVVVTSEPVILSGVSYSESAKVKQNVTPPRLVKHFDSVTPGKINGSKSPCNYPPIFKEDQELEIFDIDPCLQDKENSNLSSEDDEIIVIDEDVEQVHRSSNQGHERLFGSEQSSITNEGTNEVGERSSNCLFLLRCHNLDSENKQYPCYICHKFYGSNEVLNIHFAQTHFEKENAHVTSALCQSRKRKTKSIKGAKNMDLQSKRSDGVIRYNCSKCNAIFHEKETLNLHNTLFHEDEIMRSLIPLKQVSTPEGNTFYYCDQCSGCFHTEKALIVHKCVPFSRARSSST